jgi:hypothetical protein
VKITLKCALNQVFNVCVCVFEVREPMCGYWAGEPRCKKVSALILVKCNYTQIINKITSLRTDQSDEERRGAKLHRKEKMGA